MCASKGKYIHNTLSSGIYDAHVHLGYGNSEKEGVWFLGITVKWVVPYRRLDWP